MFAGRAIDHYNKSRAEVNLGQYYLTDELAFITRIHLSIRLA